MVRRLTVLMLLAGCGRIGFDMAALASGDGSVTDGAPDTLGQPIIPSGPKIWLRMETPASAAIDSGGGHTVACAGMCPELVPGLHGNGYRFKTQQLQVVYAADLSSSVAYSAGVWVKLASYPVALGCVWTKPFDDASGFDTYTLCVDGGGAISYDSESPVGVTDNFGGATLPLGEWHHLAITWNGSTKRGYFDGVQVGMSNAACGASAEPFALGSARATPDFFIDGTVDDAVYYTRALTAAEVMQLATP